MAYTPYDWHLSLQQRTEYIEERLRGGSPVVGTSLAAGILLLTIHQTQRKIFEIYDRLMFAGIGSQSDLETTRIAAIDFAHREGFLRSPHDVTAQRLVGSVLGPALKRAFADPFAAPFVFRGLFAELGETPAEDQFFVLNYDGEFRRLQRVAAIGGSDEAEREMLAALRSSSGDDLGTALRRGLEAWAVGQLLARGSGDEAQPPGPGQIRATIEEALADGTFEAGLLERTTRRSQRFRLLAPAEFEPALAEYRSRG